MGFYICSNCGYGTASWLGRCPNCAEFNTFKNQPSFGKASEENQEIKKLDLIPFKKIVTTQKSRLKTGIFEFDRVLGGGIIPGEVILLSGEPGIGKSTLLLQSLSRLKTAYISGEEAAEQIKDRAVRLGIRLENFLFSDDLQVEGIVEGLEDLKEKIDVVAIDSIQTVYSKSVEAPPGNISQLRECASQLISLAKQSKIAMVIIGHITKGGEIAGPKTLEHLVDCVLSFEGERVSNFRILRASKNRFGTTDEIGIFEMKEKGLEEVTNPLVFLDKETENIPGKAIVGVAEGKRSLFYEIQTLAVPSVLPVPRRVVNGLDYNRVLLLLAVIRKHLHLHLDKFDIYLNVVGGVTVRSPSADLGVIAAVFSSFQNTGEEWISDPKKIKRQYRTGLLPKKTLFIGEVGLLGEVRKVFLEDKIIKEARRLGFQKIFSNSTLSNIKNMKAAFFG